ncbi:hypothetical protein, conserved [Leishmania lindenbergi]|uniref:Uncharacterized protein n=1 Tax=Leishmania lindenbergi TaxID=651832 RepID=A0AAW3A3U2_9TRYP
MGYPSNTEDGEGCGCCGFLAAWFPGLRSSSPRRPIQDESTSSHSSGSPGSKSISYDGAGEENERLSFDELGSSATGLWDSVGGLASPDSLDSDAPSDESDPQERARRAAASFLQWKNKEYVPLSSDEKRAIKEYRKSIAQEEGSYMNARAQRSQERTPKRFTSHVDECANLDCSTECGELMRRRSSAIRFIPAAMASKAVGVHNDAHIEVTDAGEEVPALLHSASILQQSYVTSLTEESPAFVEDLQY